MPRWQFLFPTHNGATRRSAPSSLAGYRPRELETLTTCYQFDSQHLGGTFAFNIMGGAIGSPDHFALLPESKSNPGREYIAVRYIQLSTCYFPGS